MGRNALFSKAVQSTNGNHAAHKNASLINTIPVMSNKRFQTLGERPAHAIHIVIVVDGSNRPGANLNLDPDLPNVQSAKVLKFRLRRPEAAW